MNSSIKLLKTRLKNNQDEYNCLVTFINPYSYLYFRKNLSLFSSFQTIYIDGIVLVYLLRLIGVKTDRKSFDMTSLAPQVFQNCIQENKSIYFIGSTEEAITNFVNILSKSFPKLNIVGNRNGYFNNENDRKKILSDIIKINPNVVVVGMGTPYQEQFLIDLKQKGWVGDGYTCGGFIHQTAHGINYYPKFYDKYNLRWLYRMIDEPKLIKRYTILYPKAIFLFFIDYIKYSIKQ